MAPHGSGVFTIAPDRPFLDVLARAVLAGFPKEDGAAPGPLEIARWTILVPTRRAARELEDIFFLLRGGGGLLLPRIRPIGDIDEDLLDGLGETPGGVHLPEAISRPGQQLLLIDLIDDWAKANPQTRLAQEIAAAPHQAHGLAVSLAEFLDSLETEDVDAARIPGLYDLENARHREAILQFLAVAREAYPTRLDAIGRIGSQRRRSQILHREAARLAATATAAPFIAAGSTGTIEATRALLKVIAGLPNGAVVLPGLDCTMDESSWLAAGPTHPQFALKQLLASLAIDRSMVEELGDGVAGRRSWLASELMRPANTAHLWRDKLAGRETDVFEAMEDVELVEARSLPEEAMIIALILRECLEHPGRTACLVTPDRQLARRVKAELARWNIAIDDSAGEPLIHQGGAALLNLLLEAILQNFSGETLAALLRHELSLFGAAAADARRAGTLIELVLLRSGMGTPDVAALPHALRLARDDNERRHLVLRQMSADDWTTGIAHAVRISAALAPLRESKIASLAWHLDRLISACEAIAGESFWDGDAGDLLRETITALNESSPLLSSCDLPRAVGILRHWLQAIPVRQPPRGGMPLSILGLLEARLIRPDMMVLAGLNETVWPGSPDPGPWLNRPMRDTLGMSQPEREIGQTAHDFVQAFGASQVKLVWSRRSGDAPATPSRWILRLQMILKQAGLADRTGENTRWQQIARHLVAPGHVTPAMKPRPRPPVAARPTQLSVTRIETLIRDPYAIYARHILQLEPLQPVSARPDPARRGIIFHGAIGDFLQSCPLVLPDNAESLLLEIGETHFEALRDFPALTGFWWPRFRRIARWLVAQEPDLRRNVERIASEIGGAMSLPIGGDDAFTLTCRADRIDIFASGGARIIDFKTGAVPSGKQVEAGLAPQLTLQAAILEAGGFKGLAACPTDELTYIRLSGGEPPGEIRSLSLDSSVMDLAHAHLGGVIRLLTAYASPAQPYLPRGVMQMEDDVSDYDHLSRYREWTLSGGAS